MIKCRGALIMLCLLFVGIARAEDQKKLIADVNKAVAAIDDSIFRGEYIVLHIEEHSESEGAPPAISMYYRGDRLIAAVVTVGHETWSKEFRYYYNANGNPKKYMEIIKNRPDNPPKVARIYAEDGTIVWKNIENEAIKFSEFQGLFTTLQKTRKGFSKY
jgi:hypothetical protein